MAGSTGSAGSEGSMGSAIVVGVGASDGLGAAISRRFAREGLHVFLAGRTKEKLEAVAGEIEAAGGRASPVVTDTTVAGDVVRLFDAAAEGAGVPEVVAYNAGNNRMSPLLEMSDAFFEETWRLACFGGFLVGREAARRMVPSGGGSLIFTGATASLRARPPFTAFASAKAALRALAHGMAREFGPQKLHVAHVVIDGVINGEMVKNRFPGIVERFGEDGMLSPDAIAENWWTLHRQHPTTWTLELDLRPYKETF
jgi:NAD(P)-dependent dehydrogenase (short-subunit alcohol dehydrogenase family)